MYIVYYRQQNKCIFTGLYLKAHYTVNIFIYDGECIWINMNRGVSISRHLV